VLILSTRGYTHLLALLQTLIGEEFDRSGFLKDAIECLQDETLAPIEIEGLCESLIESYANKDSEEVQVLIEAVETLMGLLAAMLKSLHLYKNGTLKYVPYETTESRFCLRRRDLDVTAPYRVLIRRENGRDA